MACRHVDGDKDRARQVRRGQPDVLSDWEGAQVAVVDGDRSMISKGQDQDSASTQQTRANKVQSLWASLLSGCLAWRLAPLCCRPAQCCLHGQKADRGVPLRPEQPFTFNDQAEKKANATVKIPSSWILIRRRLLREKHVISALPTAARAWPHTGHIWPTGQTEIGTRTLHVPVHVTLAARLASPDQAVSQSGSPGLE